MLLIVKERNYLTDFGDKGNKAAGELPFLATSFLSVDLFSSNACGSPVI